MRRFLVVLFMMLVASIAYAQDATIDESTINTNNKSTIDSETIVKSPPPSAISPTINSSNSDLCTIGVAGAVQTQILGLSAGKTVRDMNCEKLKNAKTLYDMGMKVAAVSVMCQDKRVFDAMMNAGTPCPYDGLIGQEAKAAWKNNEDQAPKPDDSLRSVMDDDSTITLIGGAIVLGLFAILSIM
jgi:hypothetical protein